MPWLQLRNCAAMAASLVAAAASASPPTEQLLSAIRQIYSTLITYHEHMSEGRHALCVAPEVKQSPHMNLLWWLDRQRVQYMAGGRFIPIEEIYKDLKQKGVLYQQPFSSFATDWLNYQRALYAGASRYIAQRAPMGIGGYDQIVPFLTFDDVFANPIWLQIPMSSRRPAEFASLLTDRARVEATHAGLPVRKSEAQWERTSLPPASTPIEVNPAWKTFETHMSTWKSTQRAAAIVAMNLHMYEARVIPAVEAVRVQVAEVFAKAEDAWPVADTAAALAAFYEFAGVHTGTEVVRQRCVSSSEELCKRLVGGVSVAEMKAIAIAERTRIKLVLDSIAKELESPTPQGTFAESYESFFAERLSGVLAKALSGIRTTLQKCMETKVPPCASHFKPLVAPLLSYASTKAEHYGSAHTALVGIISGARERWRATYDRIFTLTESADVHAFQYETLDGIVAALDTVSATDRRMTAQQRKDLDTAALRAIAAKIGPDTVAARIQFDWTVAARAEIERAFVAVTHKSAKARSDIKAALTNLETESKSALTTIASDMERLRAHMSGWEKTMHAQHLGEMARWPVPHHLLRHLQPTATVAYDAALRDTVVPRSAEFVQWLEASGKWAAEIALATREDGTVHEMLEACQSLARILYSVEFCT